MALHIAEDLNYPKCAHGFQAPDACPGKATSLIVVDNTTYRCNVSDIHK